MHMEISTIGLKQVASVQHSAFLVQNFNTFKVSHDPLSPLDTIYKYMMHKKVTVPP